MFLECFEDLILKNSQLYRNYCYSHGINKFLFITLQNWLHLLHILIEIYQIQRHSSTLAEHSNILPLKGHNVVQGE